MSVWLWGVGTAMGVGVSICTCNPMVVFQSTSADEVQNIGMGSAMRRSLLFGSKSAHSMLQDTTNQDHPDVCASRQQGEESVGGEQRAKGEKGDDTAKGEEGTRVEDAMQDSVSELDVGCVLWVDCQCLLQYSYVLRDVSFY